jgi:hypothetical protein
VKSDITANTSAIRNQSGNITQINTNIQNQASDILKINDGLNMFMSAYYETTNGGSSGGTIAEGAITMDIPGSVTPDLNLLKHVNSLAGFTFKDLDYGNDAKRVKICGNDDPLKCIEIPDQSGDVLLTNIFNGKGIKMNGATSMNAPLAFNNAAGIQGARIMAGDAATAPGAFVETTKLGVGPTKAAPTGLLHLMSGAADTMDPLKISVGPNDVLKIDKEGTVFAKRIELQSSGVTKGVVVPVSDGIKITATNLFVDGNIKATGTVTPSVPPSSISTFTSGPIRMNTKTPVDYMNSRFLMPLQ